MNVFMEFFLFFMSILQFLFPFAFKDDVVVPEQTTDIVIEDVIPEDHEHTGGNENCLQSAVCEICGEVYGSRGDHVYSATVTPATCLEGGYTTYRCRFCLVSKVEDYTEATGHSFEKSSSKATCVVAGYDYYSCENCTFSYSEENEPAKGHKYKEEYSSADCTSGYTIIHRCETCKYSYSEVSSAALGHDYEPNVTEPTCITEGYTTYKCKRCDQSYKTDPTAKIDHQFTEYTPDGNASCSNGGTKTAFCDFGCGTKDSIPDNGQMLSHVDDNKDTLCDACGTEIFVDYTYLQYPAAALADSVPLDTFLEKAAITVNEDISVYEANKGTDYNGIRTSPYFTAKVKGRVKGADTPSTTPIPVYSTLTFVGSLQSGALHSFSEIYITEGEYDTFTIEIESAELNITSAVILPESSGETATVKNGKVTAVLSGFGTHTFLFNGRDNQRYAYTVHVRAQIDDDWAIEQLRQANPGASIVVIDGYTQISSLKELLYGNSIKENVYSIIEYGSQNKIIYLRKGAYLVADHHYNINSSTDDTTYKDSFTVGTQVFEGESITGVGGQSRVGAINIGSSSNVQILGYGALDLSRLDRSERRGAIISWSNNIRIQGLKLINSPQWTFVIYNCDTVNIRDVDVYGYRQNSDAFDICNSSNVTIEGCFARTGDDAFVVKTLGGDRVTDNVTVKNCYAWVGKARGFGIFGETYNDISNVTFKDNTVLFHDATWDYMRIPAIGIVVESDETNPSLEVENSGTTLTNIIFDNIEICRNRASAINTIIYKDIQNYLIDGLTFRNIKFEKINQIVYEEKTVSSVSTIDTYSSSSTIKNVVIENIICGNTKVTDENHLDYFDKNILYYCGSIK